MLNTQLLDSRDTGDGSVGAMRSGASGDGGNETRMCSLRQDITWSPTVMKLGGFVVLFLRLLK